jgi:molybdate transport system substrate-binding protein
MICKAQTWRHLRFFILIACFFADAPLQPLAQEKKLSIAAAADLKATMDDLTQQFEQETQDKLDVTYGSSGNFFSQILNGAPFDLFFSADLEYPQKLDAAGFAEPGTLFKYAAGRIVLWAPLDAKIDPGRQQWRTLLDGTVQKIAIANPRHAPYGRATISALRNAGVYDKVHDKLVYGENISQAAQFVQSGNAQVGIIAKSLALSPAMRAGKFWDIPAGMFPPIEQAVIVLKNSRDKQTAQAFLDFVRSASGQAILRKYGFALPNQAKQVN